MDIHITNKTNKSWEVAYVTEKVRQLFSKHGISKIVIIFIDYCKIDIMLLIPFHNANNAIHFSLWIY